MLIVERFAAWFRWFTRAVRGWVGDDSSREQTGQIGAGEWIHDRFSYRHRRLTPICPSGQ